MADEQVMAEELTVGGRPRGFSMRLPRAADGEIPLVLVLHGNHPDATTQEFDAAEEICRFAEPRLATAETRRL